MLKQEETLVLISLVLSEILSVRTLNKWISVTERPISKIVAEAGLNKGYSAIIMDELKKLGLVESEGQKSGLRYKIKSNVVHDISALAKKIYEKNTEKIRLYRETKKATDGYPNSKSSDLQPKQPQRFDLMNSKLNKSDVVKLGVLLPHLNDMRFIIVDDCIYEGRVISIQFESIDSNKINIDLEYVKNWGSLGSTNVEGEISYIRKRGLPLKEAFESPAAAANFLVSRCIRYVKRNNKNQV